MEFSASMKSRTVKTALSIAIGAVAGFAYYYYIGCAGGSCPLTGNPWTSTAYGAAIGFFLAPRCREDNDERSASLSGRNAR